MPGYSVYGQCPCMKDLVPGRLRVFLQFIAKNDRIYL